MTVREITDSERRDALKISYTCFHVRKPDIEKALDEAEKELSEDWAAFDDDGTMMAHIINNHFTCRFDGHEISNGGIGAVSTLPEYRKSGAIAHILPEILKKRYTQGEIVSTLMPFKHSFYRKFGYDTLTCMTNYIIPVALLKSFSHDGWVKQWHEGETACLFKEVYDKFAENYNLSFARDDEMKKHIHGSPLQERRFAYLIGDDDGACAYVVFDDTFQDPQARMAIEDYAFTGRKGLIALLGFLARFSADYLDISITLPDGIDLLKLIPDPYEIKTRHTCDYMLRTVNAYEVLKLMAKPEDARFIIKIHDEIIAENDNTFEVDGETVKTTDKAPDIETDIRAFGQLAFGISDLDEALFRNGVNVYSNIDTLHKVFVRKPVYISEHF